MTEQDTFRRLCRPLYADIHILVLNLARASIAEGPTGIDNYPRARKELLEQHHWTLDEYDHMRDSLYQNNQDPIIDHDSF